MINLGKDSQVRDSLAVFESKVRSIYRLACRHGITHALLSSDGTPSRESFLRACHSGFSKAQNLIIVELIAVQEVRQGLEKDLKSARKQRNKLVINELEQTIGLENFKEWVLRKLGDSIAWHMIEGQNYIARRLCLREQSRPTLAKSNLSSVIRVVNSYNEKDFLNFALLSDITSFVQIGDVLLTSPDSLEIIEVKEGVKNLEAAAVLQRLDENSTYEQQIDSLILDEKLRKQTHRMLRQKKRAKQVTTLINEGAGTDPTTNIPVEVVDAEVSLENYYDELDNLLGQLRPDKDWAYTAIDGCLHIGVYKGAWRLCGPHILRASAFEEPDKDYPVANLRDSIVQPFAEPLFVKPLTEDQIFDIVFGRVSVLMLLRVDYLMELFDKTSANARMLSPKASRKAQAKNPKDKLLMHRGCCVEVINESGNWILGDGIGVRIVYDNVIPSCIVAMTANDRNPNA